MFTKSFFQRAISGKVVTSFRKFNVRRRVTVLLWTMVVVLAKERCKISQRDARLRKIFRGWGTIALSICTYFISCVTCTRSLRSYLIFSFFSKFPPLFSLFPFLFFFSNNFHVQFLFPRLSIFVTKSIIQTRNQVVIRSCRQHSNWTVKKKKKGKKKTRFSTWSTHVYVPLNRLAITSRPWFPDNSNKRQNVNDLIKFGNSGIDVREKIASVVYPYIRANKRLISSAFLVSPDPLSIS